MFSKKLFRLISDVERDFAFCRIFFKFGPFLFSSIKKSNEILVEEASKISELNDLTKKSLEQLQIFLKANYYKEIKTRDFNESSKSRFDLKF